jgi:hypothetical protein
VKLADVCGARVDLGETPGCVLRGLDQEVTPFAWGFQVDRGEVVAVPLQEFIDEHAFEPRLRILERGFGPF